MNTLSFTKRFVDRVGLGGPTRRVWRFLFSAASRLAARHTFLMPALYRIRIAVEKANYHAVGDVHDLPPIFDYWANKHLVPKLAPFGFRTPDEFFVNAILDCCLRSSHPTKRFVSIGAGNCDAEARIAKRLLELGRRDFLIECLDVNPEMLSRGLEHARAAGVEGFITTLETDFNGWRPAHGYDGVIANQSLHHVLDLEHL
ncbi:MAG TPA: class I SAM-dependent methyltransferase, partial [Usitatibacter sp.]